MKFLVVCCEEYGKYFNPMSGYGVITYDINAGQMKILYGGYEGYGVLPAG